jgi:hypothetical protein
MVLKLQRAEKVQNTAIDRFVLRTFLGNTIQNILRAQLQIDKYSRSGNLSTKNAWIVH